MNPPCPPCSMLPTGCAVCTGDNLPSFTSIIATAASVFGTVLSIGNGISSLLKELTSGDAVMLGGGIGGLIIIGLIIAEMLDTCHQNTDNLVDVCVAGIVNDVVPSFNSALDELFPFTANHNRVDVVSKSKYWHIIQQSNAFVWCNADVNSSTDPDVDDDNSEIMRCYFFTASVCDAINGSLIGAVAGAAGGVVADYYLAPLLAELVGYGCASIIGCLFALLIAAIIAAASAVVGALVGGQIGKAAGGSPSNTTVGNVGTITKGDLISCTGPISIRGDDNGANVFWWVTEFSLSDNIMNSVPQPWRWCDADSQFPMDGCS